MAKKLAHFKNFAKLKDTTIAFNDITVLAGKPGVGKSYVMKFMYAIDEAFATIVSDTASMKLRVNKLKEDLLILQKLSSEIKALNQKDDLLQEKFKIFDSKSKTLRTELKDLESKVPIVKESNNIKDEESFFQEITIRIKNILNSIYSNIEQVSDKFNIQYGDIEIGYAKKKLNVSGRKDIKSTFKFPKEAIFVETPLILEFKKFMNQEKGKTPYHIESLLKILDTNYSFTDEEQDEFIIDFTQKSKEIIKGDIESSGDSFVFNKDNDKNYDIVNASSGTKSIGLLQYLVTNKALKKGSVLYWEEPEVHLHPEWQLRMIELFIELMNAGVKLVFSTHSPYMCDYLNAISQKKGFYDRVSFNLFKETDSVVENYILESDEDWNKIQAELLDPLEEIMWEYI